MKDDILDVCQKTVRLEDAFIYLAFEQGPVNGMTPKEIKKYCSRCALEKRLGYAATKRLRQLLNLGPVTLTGIDRDEDVFGRKLCILIGNGADVGERLISEGLAHRYVRGKLPWC